MKTCFSPMVKKHIWIPVKWSWHCPAVSPFSLSLFLSFCSLEKRAVIDLNLSLFLSLPLLLFIFLFLFFLIFSSPSPFHFLKTRKQEFDAWELWANVEHILETKTTSYWDTFSEESFLSPSLSVILILKFFVAILPRILRLQIVLFCLRKNIYLCWFVPFKMKLNANTKWIFNIF